MSRRGSCAENNFGAVSRRIDANSAPQNIFLWDGDRPFREACDTSAYRVEDSCVVTLVCEWDYAPNSEQLNPDGGPLVPATVPLPGDDMRPMFAQVSIGCGGITRIRECDVGRGFMIRTPCSTLKVDIVYPLSLVGDPPPTRPGVIFWTWIGCGSVDATFAPQRRTIHYGSIEDGAETVFPIPPGALAAIPFSSNGSAVTLKQRLGPTTASGVVVLRSYPTLVGAAGGLYSDAMVLVQGATHMGLQNDGDSPTFMGVIYLLTL